VALAFHEQLVDEVPHEPLDEDVDVVDHRPGGRGGGDTPEPG
jgi:hypothetical protein